MQFKEIKVSNVLHDTRTAYLRDIDATGKTMVSVGANGSGYFDWIHANCGLPRRHIGIELFLPKPDVLPENSEWVANTAGDMSDIEDDVADVVFSGQNIEHLWEHDVTNFLLESNRILKHGGLLVVDSPNRIITEALCIVHPEHMLEFTPDEMCELLSLAGFDVTKKRGIFLTRDPRNGQFLPYQPDFLWEGPWSLVERCALSDRHVRDSYLWWIEARKTERVPVEQDVRKRVRQFWEAGWPERMSRFNSELGEPVQIGGKSYYNSIKGQQGALIYGPYVPIIRGRYRASMLVSLLDDVSSDAVIGVIDVVLNETVVAKADIRAGDLTRSGYSRIWIDFSTTADTTFGLQCRIILNGTSGVSVERGFELDRAD